MTGEASVGSFDEQPSMTGTGMTSEDVDLKSPYPFLPKRERKE
jgi:hypothetical protein